MSKRILSLLLAALMLMSLVIAFPLKTDAAELKIDGLTSVQKRFVRTIGSYARAGYYQTDVLASLTLSQGIFESGWGRSLLAVGGRNLFGIKAFSTWSGKVFDQKNALLYDNYEDYLFASGQTHVNTTSAWRAHESWAESTRTHNSLFTAESRYSALIGEKDYKVAANAIVAAGYCTDAGYADNVIKIIENYGLTYYDDITPDDDGIVALTADTDRVFLDIGDTYETELTFYPALAEDKSPSSLTWASENPAVATVDKNGKITAVAHGTSLITATLANGREACVIVNVDCNATVITENIAIRATAVSTASSMGTVQRGTAVKVLDSEIVKDSSGNAFIKIKGKTAAGTTLTGYAYADKIYQDIRPVSSIVTVKDDVTLAVGEKYTVEALAVPSDAGDLTLTWSSSDTNVVTVDKDGTITAKALGTALVTATAVGGATANITVTVASAKKNYNAVISAYKTVTARTSADSGSSKAGTFYFMDKVTAVGEPVGRFIKVTGKNSSGTTVTGYVNQAYVRIIPTGYTVKTAIATADIPIYAEESTSSRKYTSIPKDSTYMVLSENGDWGYILGLASSSSVHGYANLSAVSDPDTPSAPTTPTETTVTGTAGRTTSALNVRSGASTSNASIGKLASGASVVVLETLDGWYKVVGKDSTSGEQLVGYSSSQYIKLLYKGTTTSKLNLRETASTSGTKVTVIPNGATVTVIGAVTNGWYSAEYTEDSTTYKGYCSADYITLGEKITATATIVTEPEPTPTPPAEEKFGCTNSDFKITDGYLYGVGSELTAEAFLKNFTGNVSVALQSSSSKFVGTGAILRVTENGATRDVAKVVVMGDIDGDGTLNAADYALAKRSVLGTYKLSEITTISTDVNRDDTIDALDYSLIKRAVLGTFTINQ